MIDNHRPSQQQSAQSQIYVNDSDDEIDLRELFWNLWAAKWLILSVTAVFAFGAVIFALMQTDIYRAEAVLAPAESEQRLGGVATQLGGAAALLGVNVGGMEGDNISTAIATLRSRQFLGRFIKDNNLLVPLFAGLWDRHTGRGFIDEGIYNESNDEWVSEDGEPSALEAYRIFSGILSISGPDRTTGIVTVAIDWHNPIEAADWVNKLVIAINRDIRTKDVTEASNAIDYLRNQLERTQLVDMQRVFFQLIESQTRITMLADVREEYVFRVIDPAIVPDRKVEPRRSVIVMVGTLAGVFFSLMLVYVLRLKATTQALSASELK